MTEAFVAPRPWALSAEARDKLATSGGNLAGIWKALLAGEIDHFQALAFVPWMSPDRLNRQYDRWLVKRAMGARRSTLELVELVERAKWSHHVR